jgi:hypothetical protein
VENKIFKLGKRYCMNVNPLAMIAFLEGLAGAN